ncbi:MAG: hypothetical protein DWH82_10625 [Planctomycetota bacterium]|nr:MAG: hypothetical protein DWH82_10625 [Planctomycetota bacterium]
MKIPHNLACCRNAFARKLKSKGGNPDLAKQGRSSRYRRHNLTEVFGPAGAFGWVSYCRPFDSFLDELA